MHHFQLIFTIKSYDIYHHFSTPSIEIIISVNDENDGPPLTITLNDIKTHILYEGTQVDVIPVMSRDLDTVRRGTVVLSNLLAPGWDKTPCSEAESQRRMLCKGLKINLCKIFNFQQTTPIRIESKIFKSIYNQLIFRRIKAIRIRPSLKIDECTKMLLSKLGCDSLVLSFSLVANFSRSLRFWVCSLLTETSFLCRGGPKIN